MIEENARTSAEPVADESYSITTEDGKAIIRADGYLGTMWGIYTFSEKFLGVDPCYLFNDLANPSAYPLSHLKIIAANTEKQADFHIANVPESWKTYGNFTSTNGLNTITSSGRLACADSATTAPSGRTTSLPKRYLKKAANS